MISAVGRLPSDRLPSQPQLFARARSDSGDVVKAAHALNVRLVEHSAALQRTEELVQRLDARLSQAQRANLQASSPAGASRRPVVTALLGREGALAQGAGRRRGGRGSAWPLSSEPKTQAEDLDGTRGAADVASVRALPAANRRLVVEFGTWSAPWVMATLASIVHDREDAARSQQHRDDNKQGDFHCGSPTAKGPPFRGGKGGEARGRHGLSSASGTYANTCRPVLLWRAKILH
jgi:hypothetical protein